MHEFSLVKNLIHKITSIAHEQHASKVIGVTVKLGAPSLISPDHFREHFIHASLGTVAEDAQLHIKVVTDTAIRHSQEVLLESIEIAD